MSGILMAIGGGLRLDGDLLPEFFRLVGGGRTASGSLAAPERGGGTAGRSINAPQYSETRIVILPTASELADSGYEVAQALAALGLRCPARVLPLRSREDAARPEFCQAIREASGLFLTGGDQARLAEALRGTAASQAIHEMYHGGGTVAGTSAGTAALSEMMIAFGESGALPYPDIAHFSSGLGLTGVCVFDQHFRQRNRIGRLLYAVACHPELVGIGVDEDTAAVIHEDVLTVRGSGAVTVVDGTGMLAPTGSAGAVMPLGNVTLHILVEGGVYDLKKRRVYSLYC